MKSIIPPRLEAVIRARIGVSSPPLEDAPTTAGGRDPSVLRRATSHARKRHENFVYPSPVMLPRAEIKRTLLRFRYDREFRGPRRVPIKTLADFVGLSHETLFQATRAAPSATLS
jgi:hypothetical protein